MKYYRIQAQKLAKQAIEQKDPALWQLAKDCLSYYFQLKKQGITE
jgi:hypothetical protein